MLNQTEGFTEALANVKQGKDDIVLFLSDRLAPDIDMEFVRSLDVVLRELRRLEIFEKLTMERAWTASRERKS